MREPPRLCTATPECSQARRARAASRAWTADDALLSRLGIDEVDDALVGFAEMMTIKMGELIVCVAGN